MSNIEFSICPRLNATEGEKVFFFVKDPTILQENVGLATPKFYLIEATIIKDIVLTCSMGHYTFSYDESVLVEGKTLTRALIDKIQPQDCNTQFIRESLARG